MRHKAAILAGSNIDPEQNIRAALEELLRHPELKVKGTSSFHHTEPVGPAGQPSFVNAAVVVETDLGPHELRSLLRELEARFGRERSADRFAPRTLDLDVVLFDDLILAGEDWQLPDPDLLLPHVLGPLAEVAADWAPPGHGETLAELAGRLDPRARRDPDATLPQAEKGAR